jgi:hypothetical protein
MKEIEILGDDINNNTTTQQMYLPLLQQWQRRCHVINHSTMPTIA